MAAVAAGPNLSDSLNSSALLWHVWPHRGVVAGEIRQVGFELELMGSHCPDQSHLDPECPKCQRLRFALLAVAEHITESKLADLKGSVRFDIDPHWRTVNCSGGFGNRPSVSVSIIVTRDRTFDRPIDALERLVVRSVKRCMAELGIPER